MMKATPYFLTALCVFFYSNCTNLEPEVFSEFPAGSFLNAPNSLDNYTATAYTNLYDFEAAIFPLQTISSDEGIIMRRGQDWDNPDGKRTHQHNFDPAGNYVFSAWQFCYAGINLCNRVLHTLQSYSTPETPTYIAEMKVLRAFYYYWLLDLFGNVPIITEFDANDNIFNVPRPQVFDFVENELLENIDLLSKEPITTYGRVNYYVGQAILANLYINAAVYTGNAEFNKALIACNKIIDSGLFDLPNNFFETFKTENSTSPEIIFAIPYDRQHATGHNVHMRTLHYSSQQTYNLQEQPWNGFCVLEDFYNSFESNDIRKNSILTGVQYSSNGDTIYDPFVEPEDPDGAVLNYTTTIPVLPSFSTLRQAGGRVAKYEYAMGAANSLNNDLVLFRYAEIILLKAEALWRINPSSSDALTLVNLIRNRANLADFTQLTSDNLLAERGRELAFEYKRRTDLIRFGQFGTPWFEKPASEPCKTIFPIPVFLGSSPFLTQNPCY